jgi:hypothetical protein
MIAVESRFLPGKLVVRCSTCGLVKKCMGIWPLRDQNLAQAVWYRCTTESCSEANVDQAVML